jgi:two-component system, NarL family, nitrate/nitrite response regulator NarL
MGRDCGPVLIVDDDAGTRNLIAMLLGRAGFETREAEDGHEAIRLAEEARPAAAIVDVNLGGGQSGYEVSHELRGRFEGLPVVFVSGERTESFDRVAGLLLGAADYIVKPFDPDELIARVRRLVVRDEPRRSASTLTARERDVLRLLADGLDQRSIAAELFLSPKTVATHIQHVLAKLGVHSRAQAVALAHRDGLVEADAAAHLGALVD